MERKYMEEFEEARVDALKRGYLPVVNIADGKMYVAIKNDNYKTTELVDGKFTEVNHGERYHVFSDVRRSKLLGIITPEEFDNGFILLAWEDGSVEPKYDCYNRAAIAKEVDKMIEEARQYKNNYGSNKKWRIDEVYDRLSIFDWWPEWLTVTHLKQMKSFLRIAGEFGYNGYVCFKVGAAGCAHGMWAHREETKTGYSPDGGCLFHSFRSGDNYFGVCFNDGTWAHDKYSENEYPFELTYDHVKELLTKEGEYENA